MKNNDSAASGCTPDSLVGTPVLDCEKKHVVAALAIAKRHNRINTSMVQRRLHLGYIAASRILEELELQGFIGPFRVGEDREIFCSSNAPSHAAALAGRVDSNVGLED